MTAPMSVIVAKLVTNDKVASFLHRWTLAILSYETKPRQSTKLPPSLKTATKDEAYQAITKVLIADHFANNQTLSSHCCRALENIDALVTPTCHMCRKMVDITVREVLDATIQ